MEPSTQQASSRGQPCLVGVMGQEAWILTNGSWLCDLQGAKSFLQASVSKSANSKGTNPGSGACGLDESLPSFWMPEGGWLGAGRMEVWSIRKYRGHRRLISLLRAKLEF